MSGGYPENFGTKLYMSQQSPSDSQSVPDLRSPKAWRIGVTLKTNQVLEHFADTIDELLDWAKTQCPDPDKISRIVISRA